MQISFTNKQNFNARNITIRRADNLAREVNKMFPSVSPSKMSKFGNYNFFESISDFTPLENIKSTMQTLRNKLAHAYYCRAKDIDCLISFLDNVKKYKVANCGELSIITLLIAKCKGIKNCSVRLLADKFGDEMDHSVLYVNDKKPYIIDTWLGFADYVPEAIKRYNCEFRQFINFKDGKFAGKLIFDKPEYLENSSIILGNNANLSFEEQLKIAQKYPQIFVKY